MATFIQGLTDYIPKAEPYKPNFDFLNSVLATKQARYNSAIDQLSGIYGNIINADLTRDENIESRRNFLNNAEKNIQQITSMDLSNPKNVELAQEVFQPFVQDKKIQYDIMLTKAVKKGFSEAEYLRNSSDEELKKQYWQEGEKELNYRLIDFKTASPDKAYRMSMPKYTPYINIMSAAKDILGKDFIDISIDEKKGGYIVTTKNGPLAVNTVQQLLNSSLSTDPRVRAYANSLAYVQSMDTITGLANTNYNGDINQAKADYYSSQASSYVENGLEQLDGLESELDDVESKLAMYDGRLARGSKLSDQERLDYSQLQGQKNLYEANITSINDNIKSIEKSITENDIDLIEKSSQGILARNIINRELKDAINVGAYSKYQREMKADPFELKKFEKALDDFYWSKQKAIEWAREDELKKREKEELDAAYSLSPVSTTTEAGEQDQFVADKEGVTLSSNNFGEAVKSVAASLNGINSQALNKALASRGYTYDQVMNKPIGTIGLSKITDALNEVISKDPEVAKSMGKQLAILNSKKQVAFANNSTIQKNNTVTFNNMVRNSKYNAVEKAVLGSMFTNDGSLLSSQAAYNRTRGALNMSYNDFKSVYNDMYVEYGVNYNEQAKNNNPTFKPVGMLGSGGGGTTVEYGVSGIADPKEPKTESFRALKEIISTSLTTGTVYKEGTPTDVRKQSNSKISEIESDPELQTYVSNIMSTIQRDKTPVSYTYNLMALGSTKYNSLHIKPTGDDAFMKGLKERDKTKHSKILTDGITVIFPATNKNLISRKAAPSDAEIVLNSTGKYSFYKPGTSNILFTKTQEGINMSGVIDNKPVNLQSLDIIKVNSIINTLNQY
jgi:hypothetical protein